MKLFRLPIVASVVLILCCLMVLPANAQITDTYCSTDVPVLIPNNIATQVLSNLNVPDAGVITDVIVSLQIDHTFLADLEISVISPLSTEPLLVDRVGGAGDNFGTGCSPPNFILDDASGTSVTTYTAGTAGTFSPSPDPLSFFDGEDQLGSWTMVINDTFALDGGSLNCWCLTITRVSDGPPPPPPPPLARNVPTLSEWGLIAMAGIMGIAGLMVLRRKRVSA